jgi:hypothetical protein
MQKFETESTGYNPWIEITVVLFPFLPFFIVLYFYSFDHLLFWGGGWNSKQHYPPPQKKTDLQVCWTNVTFRFTNQLERSKTVCFSFFFGGGKSLKSEKKIVKGKEIQYFKSYCCYL